MPVTREDIDKNLLTPFIETMDRHGITIDQLAKKLKSELKAKKTDTFLHQQSGEVLTAEVPDWKTRQEARKDALAYRGIIAAQRVKMEHSGSIDYSNMTDEELDAKIKEGFNAVYGPTP